MVWAQTQYSKTKVKQAGEVLIDETATADMRFEAMEIMSNWRAAHAYPMQAVLMLLRKMACRIDKNVVVVQRLKRLPSIQNKLTKQQRMSLSRMQDIAGCRAVVGTVSDTKLLADALVKSKTRHKLHRKDDYITNPKESGYRGIHLVYKYNGEKAEYKDYFVEVQIRSKIQHAWATAVEIVDTFTHQAIKASDGTKDWVDFFRYVSVEFALIEKSKAAGVAFGIDTRAKVISLSQKLNVVKLLNAFAVTTQHLTKQSNNKTDYFLLELATETTPPNITRITVTRFSPSKLVEATNLYLQKEELAKVNTSYNVVLVAANSMHALKAAYPNYFAQSKDFLKYLAQITAKY